MWSVESHSHLDASGVSVAEQSLAFGNLASKKVRGNPMDYVLRCWRLIFFRLGFGLGVCLVVWLVVY